MFAAERDIYRVLFSMAQLDPDSIGGAIEKMETGRSGGMAHLLWVLTSFESLDLLMTGRGLSFDQTVDMLVTVAERTLCR
ncbi:MAG: hypothetical protein ACRDZ3_07935 [Acidimicrobiia bacterium]